MTEAEYSQAAKAAWYYYQEGLTQQQIAKMFGVSRIKIARLLEEAREEGIVHFTFRSGTSQRMSIERDLISCFGLQDAYVIPTPVSPKHRGDAIAHAAAMYVDTRIQDNAFLNMGYGDTTSRMLNYLARDSQKTINITSLTGGVGYYLPQVNSNLRNVKLHLTPSPLMFSSPSVRDEVFGEPSIQEIYRMVSHSSMSIMSVGGMSEDSTIVRNGVISASDLTYLRMKGAVGDILSHFVDAKGAPVDEGLESRLMSIGLQTLRELDNVVGIAGGADKTDAIYMALTCGYFDVLVTDEETAKGLIAIRSKS